MTFFIPNIQTQKIRPLVLPISIVLGVFFHSFFAKLSPFSPYIIFLILFLTLCDMDYRKIRITRLHLWLMGFQLVVGTLFYFIFLPFSDTLAQGAMIGMYAPIAVSATVVAVVLGADMATMVSYTILYNLVIAFWAPVCFSLVRFQEQIPFALSFWIIIKKVAPIIIGPLILALLFKKTLPKTTSLIVKRKMLPFYIWAVALTLVIGQTIDFIMIQEGNGVIIILMVVISLLECIIQFAFGRWIGKKYGDTVAGGQALGQKNGILAVWMSQTYLDPLSSVVPATYVFWQNIFNSWQMWKKGLKS